MFKDECGGKSMTEFVGLRPKLYSYKMDNGGTTKRVKGVKRNVIERNITFDEYKKCLDTQQEIYKSMNIFRSHRHQIYTQEINKVTLSAKDTKRQFSPTELAP
ncbi:Hypothetical predicted protein [Mytilus galloprovincialis]|uniref:Uncharacterized protein n=1 Tax=Mytilus galloprovincialis TaxID=29158 RepID=A0A8B6BSY5_MYTGA|nr:Hypothetical predicted protein [Mytilus galloprovincialis]